jgi:hypothetical protein
MVVRGLSRPQALQQLEHQIRELIESFEHATDYHFRVQRTGLEEAQFAELDVRVKVYVGPS